MKDGKGSGFLQSSMSSQGIEKSPYFILIDMPLLNHTFSFI